MDVGNRLMKGGIHGGNYIPAFVLRAPSRSKRLILLWPAMEQALTSYLLSLTSFFMSIMWKYFVIDEDKKRGLEILKSK
ncbi:unnamed protein product, partial [marine sediment metagenome]